MVDKLQHDRYITFYVMMTFSRFVLSNAVMKLYLVPVGTSVVYAGLCLSPPAGRVSPLHRSSQPVQTAPSDHTSVWWSC